jgi:hypothetical protein
VQFFTNIHHFLIGSMQITGRARTSAGYDC